MFEITFLAKYICIFFFFLNKVCNSVKPKTEPNQTELEFNQTEPKTEFEFGLVWFTV